MKQIICEMCGSSDLVKTDGLFVCQNCGSKYSVEEAKKMMVEVEGTVRVDNSEKLRNLYLTARRYRDQDNSENAAKYYDLILAEDPDSWEAQFYSVYYTAKSCTIGNIASAADSVANCLPDVFRLIEEKESPEDAVKFAEEVYEKCRDLSIMMGQAAQSHYDGIDISIRYEYRSELTWRKNRASNLSSVASSNRNRIITSYKEGKAKEAAAEYLGLDSETIYAKGLEAIDKKEYLLADTFFDALLEREKTVPVLLAKAFVGCHLNRGTSYSLEFIRSAAALPAPPDFEGKDTFLNGNAAAGANMIVLAAFHFDYEAVKVLADLGADVNIANSGGQTALWHVSHKRLPEDKAEAGRKIARILLDKGASVDVIDDLKVALYNPTTDYQIKDMIKEKYPNATMGKAASNGCYVATAVYGSYDCPEVWTLRRFRDNTLAETWYGRVFIHTYYAVSPTLVKWFGETEWFKNMWKPKLDSMVKKLQAEGVESSPYEDKSW